ncbi:TPA: helix-turn-helix domain-containing protein [Bacillus cereus]
MHVRIKETRKKFGDTLQSLAQKIDYDYSNLSKVERGVYAPSLELLYKIATTYNINVSELLLDPNPNGILNLEESVSVLAVDGQKLSTEELNFLIQSIRIFRQSIKKYHGNDIF